MAVPASGAFRASAIRDTFRGQPAIFRLGDFRRGHPSGYVRANQADNPATNLAAGVTDMTVPLRLNVFRGQLPGWTYVNSIVRLNNFYVYTGFGSDWWIDWGPKTFTNNNAIGATSTGYYACIIHAGAGNVTFINNSEIQGAGGQPNSEAGQIALVITALTCALTVVNNGAIRGGGGAGGVGGTGGAGGTGYYNYTAQEGPLYQANAYEYRASAGGAHGLIQIWWGGGLINAHYAPPYNAVVGIYTYNMGPLVFTFGGPAGSGSYQVYRQWTATQYTGGAAGGAGGNGGRGIGYGSANLGGSGGAAGGNNGGNSGVGGTGGTGGTGGSWGLSGANGNPGGAGATGNYSGGAGGAAGGAGGAGGYAIWADSAWRFPTRGTTNGPIGPTQPS